jgi:hypothetical protein
LYNAIPCATEGERKTKDEERLVACCLCGGSQVKH